jgi:hypothetical protein
MKTKKSTSLRNFVTSSAPRQPSSTDLAMISTMISFSLASAASVGLGR